MAASSLFLSLFFFSFLSFQILADSSCPKSFTCRNLGSLEFPLSNNSDCGLFMVNCTTAPPQIQLEAGGTWYEILDNISSNSFHIQDRVRQEQFNNKSCVSLYNFSLPNTPSTSFTISPNLTMILCNNVLGTHHDATNSHFLRQNCPEFTVDFQNPANTSAFDESAIPNDCWKLELPRNPHLDNYTDLFSLVTANFTLEWHISSACIQCHRRGGQCDANYHMDEFQCRIGKSQTANLIRAAAISGTAVFLLTIIVFSFVIWIRCRKIKKFHHLSRNISAEPSSSKSDIDDGSFCYSIPIFSYTELEEATNNFDPSKELGDGGFGTVYHGILRDGTEVAIKRLYEHNYKRVEQFINEIKILTCLKHQNLVTLYGCTSRRSRDLLLVYEYVQNGTVKQKAKEAPLTWAVRMNIVIEAASALAYLHKSDIVHRDVKTNNILLDSNFAVKVADFGLSRLFPTDVTHISTAPQGTPGYVDPEYHRCYQLTEKSDVYSFGVVLIELISSMPAVDVTRHKDEINLATFALNRIQKCAFDDLIDSSLGYNTDTEIMRMTTSVAELAFQCLQLDKEMRPSMDQVLVFLMEVKKGGAEKVPPSPETDEVGMLKNKDSQSSPTSITDEWISGSTTASSVG